MLSALHSAHRASLLREKRQTKALQDIGSKRLSLSAFGCCCSEHQAPVEKAVVDVLDLVLEISRFQQQAQRVLRGK